MRMLLGIAAAVVFAGCGVEAGADETVTPNSLARQPLSSWTNNGDSAIVRSDPAAARTTAFVASNAYDLSFVPAGGSWWYWSNGNSFYLAQTRPAVAVEPFPTLRPSSCTAAAALRGGASSVLFRAESHIGLDGCFTGEWRDIGGSTATGPALTSRPLGSSTPYDVRFDVFINSGGTLSQSTASGTSSFDGFTGTFSSFATVPLCGSRFCTPPGPPAMKSGLSPAAVSWGPNRIDVVYIGTDDAIWHAYYDGAWQNRKSLGGVSFASPSITSTGPGNLEVVVRGTNGLIYQNTYNSTWSGWRGCTGPSNFTGAPSIGASGSTLTTWARDSSNNLWSATGSCL